MKDGSVSVCACTSVSQSVCEEATTLTVINTSVSVYRAAVKCSPCVQMMGVDLFVPSASHSTLVYTHVVVKVLSVVQVKVLYSLPVAYNRNCAVALHCVFRSC